MYWVDDKERSVASLARALGVKPTPPGFAMFFEASLEGRLLKLELAQGRTEAEIEATDFEVYKTPNGDYDVKVIRQTLKRR
jgi:hypothetical protein